MKKSLKYLAIALAFSSPYAHAKEDPELMCLAKNIFHEARGESIEGQIAVGVVTLNRVESSKYPDSICNVVYQPYQFSWTIDEPRIKKWAKYHKIKDLAHLLLNHEVVSDVGDALFYHAETIYDPVVKKRVPFKPFWADSFQELVQIENHIFYVEK